MQTCLHCHFLSFDGSQKIEKKNRTDKFIKASLIGFSKIGCYKKIWELNITKEKENQLPIGTPITTRNTYKPSKDVVIKKREEEIVEQINRDRKSEIECFYFEKMDHMAFEAAEELQKRAAEKIKQKAGSIYLKIGLIVSIAAFLTSVFFNILQAVTKCPAPSSP